MSNKKVIILRGISGSGKSTYIKNNIEDHSAICSADHYFIDRVTGNYNFDPMKLHAAHKQCQSKFKSFLEKSQPLVVVDNTNTRIKEMSFYLDNAKEFGYEIEVVRLIVDPEIAMRRNAHGVPPEAILAMHNRFVDYKGEIIVYSGT